MTKNFQQIELLNSYDFLQELAAFKEFGEATIFERMHCGEYELPVFINEFWTSKQRAGDPLHEISYRACFKPQLPRFFIERLTNPGDVVYDPFMGRGTSLLEAALLGRRIIGCDINPLSQCLLRPRIEVPCYETIEQRLEAIDFLNVSLELPDELLVFYHPQTLQQILALREYLRERELAGNLDIVDRWIQMVATNRLTGHSNGFFSVYTMPPNQAVSVKSQIRINEKRQQTPPIRDVKSIILKKSRSLLRGMSDSQRDSLKALSKEAVYLTGSCDDTPRIESDSVQLVVTSPPFLDVVDYREDNWLRGWFNNIDTQSLPIWQLRKPEDWVGAMRRVFKELYRILKPNGYIAFEVGEIRGGKTLMEELVLKALHGIELIPELLLINAQEFTKTANCWGVSNSKKGTNTNRILLLRKTGVT